MKLLFNKYILILAVTLCLLPFSLNAQDFTVIVDHSTIVDTVGSEMIFEFEAINTSSSDLTLFIARAQNDIPEEWQSSLCFEYCFAPFIDTIETTSQWGSSPLAPGDTVTFSIHVLALSASGTGHLRIVVGNVNNPSDTASFNLTATTEELTPSFTLTVDHTSVTDTVGSEMIFEFEAINTSANDLTLYIARTKNDIPENWQSSLCFEYCFAPMVDTIETTSEWGSSPLAPGDTVFFSVHVLGLVDVGTGSLTIVVGDASNNLDTIAYDLTASTQASAVESTEHLYDFSLYQNYPNPFNPTTIISYAVPHRTNVNIKVYDITGKEIATLVNEVKDQGIYNVEFNAENLSSGIYFYKISADRFSTVRKMILIK